MELLDQLPSLGINLTAAQGATVIAVLGAVKLLKPRLPITPRYKPFVVFGVAFVLTVAVELLSGSAFVLKEVAGLSLVTSFAAIAIHGTQKAIRKDGPRSNDPFKN